MIPEPFKSMLLDAVAGRKPLAEANRERVRTIDTVRRSAMRAYPDLFVSAEDEADRGLPPRRWAA